ncbi:MAG: hypothetical protein L7H18_00645 [Candidatus Nealsonbacteria bacterium DGGOD1a]|jgi:hypothetical protein|nr:MAG: hypothetical protein L7H18_00645 [Candidatus Nealsonbacteria bacterium DGGOD1a]
MRGNKIIIIVIGVVFAVMAAIGFWEYAGGFLGGNDQKPQFQPLPKTESVENENKNSGSIDLVRPPFLDE